MLKSMHRLWALAFALGIVPIACGASAGPDLSQAYDGFGLRLFSMLSAENAGKNTFVSPTSIALALAIVTGGAAGSTRTSMLKTLGVPDASVEGFNASNKALVAELSNPGSDLHFTITNALWLNKQFSIVPAFVTTSRDVFAATAQDLPFGEASAAKTINDWVDTHTNGRIPEIVDSTNPDDVMVVTNAIAMKAKWLTEFEKSDTHDAQFETGSGGHVTASMMTHNGSFAYADKGGWQVARLPYRGDRFAMYVLLPHKGTALHDALHAFDSAAFDGAISGLSEQYIAFSMPRYTATYKAELNAPLSTLGMSVAFEPGSADFSKLVEPPQHAFISLVVHRAFVRVDEEGTEAAAATAVTMRALAIRQPPETRMIVDRPFLMAIRDDRTKQILFLGAIYHPERPSTRSG
ncbi:MAG TPA: serpin family protein [Candidatus Baltobacteraceae bacterium]|nr:serpin family protein [Candidatus Baltobacteraceae bacterium]